jgi:hypothetical protein
MTGPSYAADGGRVQLSSLQIGKRHRTLSRAKVTALAESIKAIGLHQPISVYKVERKEVKALRKVGSKKSDSLF